MSGIELVATAKPCRAVLGNSADLVERFLRSQFNPDGGGRNRDGGSDLYYTVFALQGMLALGTQPPWGNVAGFIASRGSGESLDLVHLASLVRCRSLRSIAGDGKGPPAQVEESLRHQQDDTAAFLRRLETFRAGDGGYAPHPRASSGTLYGLYLAMGIHEDLHLCLADTEFWTGWLKDLRLPEGGWANKRGVSASSLTVSAAAVAILGHLKEPFPPQAGAWIRSHWHPRGGFRASLATPLPDLLTTATALHALNRIGWELSDLREASYDYIDSLWTNAGGFHGHWADDFLDSEYTFYGLLALGLLSSAR